MDKYKVALLPKLVDVVGMKRETTTLIWLKRYYISDESDYESLNGESVKENMKYIYPSQNKFTFLSLIKLVIFSALFFSIYIILMELII